MGKNDWAENNLNTENGNRNGYGHEGYSGMIFKF